jgi:hypothetical protein
MLEAEETPHYIERNKLIDQREDEGMAREL